MIEETWSPFSLISSSVFSFIFSFHNKIERPRGTKYLTQWYLFSCLGAQNITYFFLCRESLVLSLVLNRDISMIFFCILLDFKQHTHKFYTFQPIPQTYTKTLFILTMILKVTMCIKNHHTTLFILTILVETILQTPKQTLLFRE